MGRWEFKKKEYSSTGGGCKKAAMRPYESKHDNMREAIKPKILAGTLLQSLQHRRRAGYLLELATRGVIPNPVRELIANKWQHVPGRPLRQL